MDKQTVMINASALKDSSCERNFFLKVVEGYRGRLNSNDIEWGSAFHRFRSVYREKGNEGFAEAVHAASLYFKDTPMMVKSNKKYLTLNYLHEACIGYQAMYEKDLIRPLADNEGKPLLEIPFCFPVYQDDVLEVLAAGTIDEISRRVDGRGITMVQDCKTTSMWDKESYFYPYRLSTQMLQYTWALTKYAKEFPESKIAEYVRDGVGVIIDGVFHSGSSEGLSYARSEVFIYKQETIDEYEVMIHKKIAQLRESILTFNKTGRYPLREGMLNGACQTKFGLCSFFSCCSAPDEETEKIILNANFMKEFYNPLKQQGL